MSADAESDFRRLLHAHSGVLWRIAGAYARTRPDREDLYQEMLLHVWRALPSFRGEASERTWLTRIAFNVALGTLRRDRARATVDAPLAVEAVASDTPDPSDHVAHTDALSRLYDALSRLPEIDRALVVLTLEERRHAEIAEILGLSVSNVAVRLHRAKAELAALVADPVPTP